MALKDELEPWLKTLVHGGCGREQVLEALQGLDRYLQEHQAVLPRALQHYLSHRSYEKALAWLQAHSE